MALTHVRLVEGTRELVLVPRLDDIVLTSIDVPSPAVRAATRSRTDTDGEHDTTTRHGARAVSLELRCYRTPTALVGELGTYLHPSSRPWLHVRDDEWPQERRLRLRADQFAAPVSSDVWNDQHRPVQLQWRAPAGVWEATDPVELTVLADAGQLDGRTYPLAHPRTYPMTMPIGAVDHVNPGSTWVHQRALLYGPAVGPRYTNDLTGETIAFTEDLVIPAGDYVEIDTAARTAHYLSDPEATRLHLIDFEATSWWQLAPGLNPIRYHPVSGVEAGAAAVATYHPAWLLA